MVGAAVEINVLGPVEVWVGGQLVTLPRRQMNRVLGLLALARPGALGRDRLIDLLWPEQPPRRAHAVLQTRISELRSSLRASAQEPTEIGITSVHGGYRLEAPAETVDAWRFESAVQLAGAHDSLERACAVLTSALGLWRGSVLGESPAGDDGDSSIGRRLESLRLTAAEDLFAMQLHRGNGAGVLDDVLALSRANPDRERLFAEAMLALHVSGRSPEALHRYDLWRRSLRDDLGVDPGSELRALHLAILTGKVDLNRHTRAMLPVPRRDVKPAFSQRALPAPRTLPSPRTLPPDIADFAGREPQLRRLRSLLTSGDGTSRAVAVCGPGGIGKSAICTRVAHATATSFPDGQIYLDLHSFDPEGTVPPATALGRILRLLGVDPAAVPIGLDERVELYRQLTAHRTLLVVLDNAASDDQVLPLLPGGTTSRVLINSRRRLGVSFGATSIALEVLDSDAASQLLAHLIGTERLEREPQAAARLVAECGGLPLALRIVAARLLSNPHCPVARIVHQLADERSKLNQFSHAHLDVRTTISLSYQGLKPSAKALLRRIADLGLRDVTVAACAAALDVPVSAAERELETLSEAQFLHACGQDSAGFTRYRLYDLVRLFSVERAFAEESEPDLRTARQRVLGHYLRVADAAYRGTSGGELAVSGPAPRWSGAEDLLEAFIAAPMRWFEIERANIVVLVERAAGIGEVAACWDLACTTSQLFAVRQYTDEWSALILRALSAAQQAGDVLGQAAAHHRLGLLYAHREDFLAARAEFERSVTLFGVVGNARGVGLALAYTGAVERFAQRPEAAIRYYRRAITTLRPTGDTGSEAFALRGMGQAEMDRAHYAAAAASFEQALTLYRSLPGAHVSVAQVNFCRGMLFTRQSRFAEAEALFAEVGTISRQLDDPSGQAQALRGLAICQHERDDKQAAACSLEEALRLIKQATPTFLEGLVQATIDDLGYRGLIAIDLQRSPAR